MEVRALHPSKALVPMAVTVEGILMEVKELHPSKALFLMALTPEEICTEAREVQCWNRYSLISVMPVGRTISVRLVHPEKDASPMRITDDGMLMDVKPLQP